MTLVSGLELYDHYDHPLASRTLHNPYTMTNKPFGSLTPFGENSWARSLPSPYYNQSHATLRAELRSWLEEDQVDFEAKAHEWSESGDVPQELYKEVAKLGIVA